MKTSLLLVLSLTSAAFAQNNAQYISRSIPAQLSPGQTTTVSVTMKNTGTTTWNSSYYKLAAINPQDSTVWRADPRVYLNPGETVAPGQQKTFTFSITAPTTKGIYNFRWQMIEEGVQFFGGTTPADVIMVSAVSCSFASPNDSLTDDAGLQCLVAQGGEIRLAPARPESVPDQGYLIGSTGMDIMSDATKIYGGPGTRTKARIKAASTLSGDILLRSRNWGGLELIDLIFDGNRDARDLVAICPKGFRENVTMVEIWDGNAFFVSNNEFRRSPCGAALAVSGWGYTIESNLFEDNGLGWTDPRPADTDPWADGVRVESCHGRWVNGQLQRAQFLNNTFRDSTDLSFSIGATSNCTISGNTMVQNYRWAFGALALDNQDHPGTIISNNTIQGNSKMSIGLSVGGNPWCVRGMAGGATISGNTISGAYYGMNVQDSTHSISGNTILSHVTSGGRCVNGTDLSNARCNIHNAPSGMDLAQCSSRTSHDLDDMFKNGTNVCCEVPVP